MPRPKRLNIAGIPQHLLQRGNNRAACFRDSDDFRLYLHLLAKACSKHSCDVHAYVLMTNHVHLLLTPKYGDGASLVFRDLGRDYVRRFNKRHGRTGTLWEGRFKSSLIDSEEYLLTCYRYIESNPVRARMVDEPGAYPWSSYRANALGAQNSLITAHDVWSALGSTNYLRRKTYRSLFGTEMKPEHGKFIRRCLEKGLPTGNEGFKRRLERNYSVEIGSGKRGRPRTRGRGCSPQDR